MYNQDRYISVAIARPGQAKFSTGDLLAGSAQEKGQAAETYVSYYGRYELRGDTVVHHDDLSLFPNWVGLDQERLIDLRGIG